MLKELEVWYIQQFYSEKLRTVKPNFVIHYHAVIHQALKYAMKTDLVPQNVAIKVDRPKKNDFQPVLLKRMQKNPAARRVTGFFDTGECGIRTHVPKKGNRISSAARYDHFDNSPYLHIPMIITKKDKKANQNLEKRNFCMK